MKVKRIFGLSIKEWIAIYAISICGLYGSLKLGEWIHRRQASMQRGVPILTINYATHGRMHKAFVY